MKWATKVDMILTEQDILPIHKHHASDPETKHFLTKKSSIYMAETVTYHAPNGRRKVLKSRDPSKLPLGWIDYSLHIEWEVSDNEPYPYYFSRLLAGEAYMLCNECGARLWSFDGKEDKDTRCPYRGTDKGKLYGCE
jgi:hypothetical protein